MGGRKGLKKVITDYWFEHYISQGPVGHCSLCGNTGTIDTRTARTPAGVLVGRLNWCICPNGQLMRHANGGNP